MPTLQCLTLRPAQRPARGSIGGRTSRCCRCVAGGLGFLRFRLVRLDLLSQGFLLTRLALWQLALCRLAGWPLGWWPLVVVVGLLVVMIGGEWELGLSAVRRGLSALPPVAAAVLVLLAAKSWLRMLLTRSRETRGSDAWLVAV